jgi:hypothetical protein
MAILHRKPMVFNSYPQGYADGDYLKVWPGKPMKKPTQQGRQVEYFDESFNNQTRL